MLMFYLTHHLRVEFIIWHKIKMFYVWTCSFNYRGHVHVYLCTVYLIYYLHIHDIKVA